MMHFNPFLRNHSHFARVRLAVAVLACGLALGTTLMTALPTSAATAACFAEVTGDNTTDFSSSDASALRSAVAVAPSNAIVKLAGTCAGTSTQNGSDQVATITKTLTVLGGFTTTNWNSSNPLANPTILDAQNGGRVLIVNAATKLDGLTIKNGNTSDSDGGGVYASTSLTLSRMTFSNNSSVGLGGGAYIEGSANMTATTFSTNTADTGGGAYVLGTASISNSVFANNSVSNHAGGLDVEGSATVSATLFQSNTAPGGGGGAYFSNGATLLRSVFIGNQSTNGDGGGARIIGVPSLSANTFIGNSAGEAGGGLAHTGGSTGSIANNLFAGNTGGNGAGLYINTDGYLQVINNTVASSTLASGAGVYVGGGTVAISNTLIASHTFGIDVVFGTATENYNLFSNVTTAYNGSLSTGVNSITATAAFTAPSSNDYHLLNGSAGLNAGINTGLSSDYDSERRPQGGGYDIGYDETPFEVSLSLSNSGNTLLGSDTDFTATLTNGANFNYTWDFGDGSTASGTANALTHLYRSAGIYTTYITATNGISTLVASSAVTILDSPQYCFAEYTGDNDTDYSSTDASALRHALAAASGNGLVKVAGTCVGVSTIDGSPQVAAITKTLTLQGGYTNTNWNTSDPNANPTLLDAQNAGRVLLITVDATVQGLTVTQGAVATLNKNGSAIYAQSALTLTDVSVYSNSAKTAIGTVYVVGVSMIDASMFYSNSAGIGGAFYGVTKTTITASEFAQNFGGIGGAVYVAGPAALNEVAFTSNVGGIGGGLYVFGESQLSNIAFNSNSAAIGGGLFTFGATKMTAVAFNANRADIGGAADLYASAEIEGSSFLSNIGGIGGAIEMVGPIAITDTTFAYNTGAYGGAIDLHDNLQLKRVVFRKNNATYGGALSISSSASKAQQLSNVLLADNVATSTLGSAIYANANSNLALAQVTIAASTTVTGSAVYMINGAAWFTDTLIANQAIGYAWAAGSITDSHTLFSGVTNPYSGTDALSSNALTGTASFVDATDGNYHLSNGSAGINVGTDAGLSDDYDGDTRPQGGGYDIGFDETTYSADLTLVASDSGNFGNSTIFTATLSNASVYSYTWDFGDGSTANSSASATYPDTATISHTYASEKGYTAQVSVYTHLGVLTATVYVQVGRILCFAEYNGDNVTDFVSGDASALRDAVAVATAGGTVKIAGTCAGTENTNGVQQVVKITKTLTLQGGYTNTNWSVSDPDANPTTVDAQGTGRVINISQRPTVTLQGFTVTNGDYDSNGAGIVSNGSLTLIDMSVYSNTTLGVGGAVFGEQIDISNSSIISNWALYSGGGVYGADSVYITNSSLMSNASDIGGAIHIVSDAANPSQIFESYFASNHAIDEGGAIFVEADSTEHTLSISATRFVSNSALLGGAALYVGNGAQAILDNNLLAHNNTGSGPIDIGLGGSHLPARVTARHNTFVGDGSGVAIEVGHDVDNEQAALSNNIITNYGVGLATATRPASIVADGMLWYSVTVPISGTGITVTNTYTGDPAFVDPSADNYHIASTSAALNRGVATGVAMDFDGDARPQGGGIDLGFDETSDDVELAASASDLTVMGDATTFTASLTGGGGFTYTWDFADGTVLTASATGSNPERVVVTHTYTSVGEYDAVVTATNGITTLVGNATAMVGNAACFAEYNGDNVTDFRSIDAGAVRSAIVAASAGGMVKIAGTCAGVVEQNGTTQVAYINKELTLQGGYTNTNWTSSAPSANATVLDAQQGGRVLYIVAATTLQGFTVTHGLSKGDGGGIYTNQPLTLTQMWVYSNTATSLTGGGDGGGVAFMSSAVIDASVIDRNLADQNGGGAWFGRDAVITGSLFSHNVGFWGGGASFSARFITISVSGGAFSDNTASVGGGGALISSDSYVTGTTFLHNSAWLCGGVVYNFSVGYHRLLNTLFAGNDTSQEGADLCVRQAARAEVIHSTFAGALLVAKPAIYISSNDKTTLISNTLIASHTIGIQRIAGAVTEYRSLFSDVTNPYSGIINSDSKSITGTALFVDPAHDNYHLSLGSAGINASDLAIYGVNSDADGDARLQGGAYDIGYDETPYSATLVASNNGPQTLGNAVQLSATLSHGTGFTYTWDFGDGQVLGVATLNTSHVYANTGRYTATITAGNGLGVQSASTLVDVVAMPTDIPTATPTETSTPTGTPSPSPSPSVSPSPTAEATASVTATPVVDTRVFLPLLSR